MTKEKRNDENKENGERKESERKRKERQIEVSESVYKHMSDYKSYQTEVFRRSHHLPNLNKLKPVSSTINTLQLS